MKKALCILCLIFVTGCSVNYDIVINKDLSISESLSICEKEEFFNPHYNSTKDRIINNIYNVEKEELDILGYSKENYKVEKDGEMCYGKKLTNTYNNLEEFVKNKKVVSQYWDSLVYENNNNIITLKTIGEFDKYVEQDPEKYIVEDAIITLKLPFDIIKTNADCIKEKENNICKWHIDKETENLELFITFDANIKEKEVNNKFHEKITNPIIKYIFWGIIGAIALVLAIKFLKISVTRNKM